MSQPWFKTKVSIGALVFCAMALLGLIYRYATVPAPQQDKYDPNYYDAVKMYTRPL